MLCRSVLLTALAGALLAESTVTAAPANKCVINGSVTYQQGSCPSDQVRKEPSVKELNAAQRAKREAAASAPPVKTAAAASRPASGGFTCDGRTHCSQMTSCVEAKLFLAHCPGVKMDGDANGIPCEKQWCTR